jgi:hypothetical protein
LASKALATCSRIRSWFFAKVSIEASGSRHEALERVAVERISERRKFAGSMVCPSFASSSKMICASTPRVMSSPVLASLTTKSAPPAPSGEVVQRHVAALRGVVEPAVGVFLDDDRGARGVGLLGQATVSCCVGRCSA